MNSLGVLRLFTQENSIISSKNKRFSCKYILYVLGLLHMNPSTVTQTSDLKCRRNNVWRSVPHNLTSQMYRSSHQICHFFLGYLIKGLITPRTSIVCKVFFVISHYHLITNFYIFWNQSPCAKEQQKFIKKQIVKIKLICQTLERSNFRKT